MMIFAATLGATFMLLAGMALLVYFLMRKSHLQEVQKRSRVVTDVKAFPRSRPTWQTTDQGVELAEVVRDLSGQLTTKMIVLEQLLADSEKQIERMEKLLAKMEAVSKD